MCIYIFEPEFVCVIYKDFALIWVHLLRFYCNTIGHIFALFGQIGHGLNVQYKLDPFKHCPMTTLYKTQFKIYVVDRFRFLGILIIICLFAFCIMTNL